MERRPRCSERPPPSARPNDGWLAPGRLVGSEPMRRQGLAVLAGSICLGLAGLALAEPDPPPSGAHHGRPAPSGFGRPHGGPGAFPSGFPSGFHPGRPAPSGSAPPRSWQAELAEQFRKHRPNHDEATRAITEARATSRARREAHIAELKERYPRHALASREGLGELRAHARRMAFLNRAKVVATTELDEPKRTTTLARIDKLLAAEQTRHQKRMEALRTPAAAPSGAPSAVAAGAASTDAPAAPKGSAP